ncbi:hypothetical protein AB3S75_025951 [Citrus x aurantiifolia]
MGFDEHQMMKLNNCRRQREH